MSKKERRLKYPKLGPVVRTSVSVPVTIKRYADTYRGGMSALIVDMWEYLYTGMRGRKNALLAERIGKDAHLPDPEGFQAKP